VIAVDTNILIYAHRVDAPWHGIARPQIASLAESNVPWAIPWPCLHEFIAIVTHPRIYALPTPLDRAFEQIDRWTQSPRIRLIGESQVHLNELKSLALSARISGPKIHDAKVAAICLQHGVSELWTADRDFSRFPSLKTRNPLVA
jgi:uncharacterized protein